MKEIIKNILGFYRCKLGKIKTHGKCIYIGSKTKVVGGKNIFLGNFVNIMPYNMLCSFRGGKVILRDGVEVGMFSRIAAINRVEIGKNVITGPNVFIADYNHEYRDISKPIKYQGSNSGDDKDNEVIIGDDSWIGTNTVISGNVKIGKHCVIGANSVVTKDIDDFSVAVGNPCRIIKKYNEGNGKWEKI